MKGLASEVTKKSRGRPPVTDPVRGEGLNAPWSPSKPPPSPAMKETAMQRPDLRSWGSENDVEKTDAAGGGGVGKRAEAEVRMEGRSAAGGE